MAPQYYKIVTTDTCDIFGWTILSRLLHDISPDLGEMNGYVHDELFTLVFKQREKMIIFMAGYSDLLKKIISR